MKDLSERLIDLLSTSDQPQEYTALTADASTREFFRISWNGRTSVACVYPEAHDPAIESYLDVTKLFLDHGLPVAEIYDYDESRGILILEDLGDQILRDLILKAKGEAKARLQKEAMSLIARIQTVTDRAYELDSVASKLKFDREKLEWELQYFKKHFFDTYLKIGLSPSDSDRLDQEFEELSTELESFASTLCHRDFHAANLMIDPNGKMRIIDHQDARIGSPTYDLVSFLLDRIVELPSPEWLSEQRRFFIELRLKLGLPKLNEDNFAYQFRLQTIQRCLKAAGTFSYQSTVRGKAYFVPFIEPMLKISIRATESLGRFPETRRILKSVLG